MKKKIIAIAFLFAFVVFSCRKNDTLNHESPSIRAPWTTTNDSLWFYGLNDFLADVVGDSLYDAIEMHRGLRYLEAGLNYTLCPLVSSPTTIVENTFTTSFSVTVFTGDSIISGIELKNLYEDIYESISDLADTTLIDSGYDHYINAVDLVWNDPTGSHSEITLLDLEIHVYHAVSRGPIEFCVDPGWSVEQSSGSCGVPAYEQFPGPLNNSECNPYLGCVYVFGAPTDVFLCHLDIETISSIPYVNPTQCYTRTQMQSLLDSYESHSDNNRPLAFNGSTKDKTILTNYETSLKVLGSDNGVGMKVTYANCFHTWVERGINPIFQPTQ